jgi:hypothetical protein
VPRVSLKGNATPGPKRQSEGIVEIQSCEPVPEIQTAG